jgi:hypothetical protein
MQDIVRFGPSSLINGRASLNFPIKDRIMFWMSDSRYLSQFPINIEFTLGFPGRRTGRKEGLWMCVSCLVAEETRRCWAEMPPHKYYCDYCDKQFYDTPASRKRHLKGISHQRAKKQWFDSFKGSYALSSLFGPPYLHYSPILPRQLVHFINQFFVIESCSK